jgi:hypothetical protein
MSVKIFCCYAHEDESLLDQLKRHLKPLQRQGLIDVWHDRDISAGKEWENVVKEELNVAQIILLLVSPHFIDSDYCYSIELKRAIERHDAGDACVIPIIIRPVNWKGAPFDKLQALPKNSKPVSRWSNRDEAFLDVASKIQQVIEEQSKYPIGGSLSSGHIQLNKGRIDDTDRNKISAKDLNKHVLVVGVTGSGKTTTIMNLLERVVEAERPFLVIEPTKTEYRALHGALAGRAGLQVYTLGNENIAPFRLNPFEFETNDEPGNASIVNHIDFLKEVFNASYNLYSPMPYILEIALHEVYEDKGWDLATGLNIRLPDWTKRDLYPIFPTLSDLFTKIEIVAERLGYNHEKDWNVKEVLQATIASLRIGSKGLMIDTARGISMRKLLTFPTILEMEYIGGDGDKAFLMGLLLVKIYEYRRLHADSGMLTDEFQHMIVFEEAHRLFRNTLTNIGTELSAIRPQAIEVFTTILSKIRAYGQSVLIAEQMPSKLAPDVLKKTKLKVAHRLVAQDDRESVGRTMNLNADQIIHLSVLLPGEAMIHTEGTDQAYSLQLGNYKRKLSMMRDTDLMKVSPAYISLETCLAILDIGQYGIPCSSFGGPKVSKDYQSAGKILETTYSKWLWASILIRIVLSPSRLLDMIEKLAQQIMLELPNLQPSQHDAILRMLIVRGCAKTLDDHKANFNWNYPMVEEMRLLLTRGLITLVQTKDLLCASDDLNRFARKYEECLTSKQGPFAGCVHCSAKCIYRPNVRHLLSPTDLRWINSDLKDTSYKTRKDRYTALASLTKGIAERWLGQSSFVASEVGYCGALHAVVQLGLTEYEQALFGDLLASSLLK